MWSKVAHAVVLCWFLRTCFKTCTPSNYIFIFTKLVPLAFDSFWCLEFISRFHTKKHLFVGYPSLYILPWRGLLTYIYIRKLLNSVLASDIKNIQKLFLFFMSKFWILTMCSKVVMILIYLFSKIISNFDSYWHSFLLIDAGCGSLWLIGGKTC